MVALSALVLPAPGARACSCASAPGDQPALPLAFEGTAVELLPMSQGAPVWRFHVLRADRGAAPGSEVEVKVSVPTATPDGNMASSCDLSSTPMQAGARYRVTAYVFGDPDGKRHFSANQCGGSLELIKSRGSDVASPPIARNNWESLGWTRPAVVAVVGAAAAAAFVVARKRRGTGAEDLEPPADRL